MSKLNETDIQGFVLRGYNMPFARYLFLHFEDAKSGSRPDCLPAQPCNHGPALGRGKAAEHRKHRVYSPRPPASGTSGRHAAELSGRVSARHEAPCRNPRRRGCELARSIGTKCGARIASTRGSASTASRGRRWTPAARPSFQFSRRRAEHPCSDPRMPPRRSFEASQQPKNTSATPTASAIPTISALNVDRKPGQGKLLPDGTWAPLATGELLLGYADEAGELPVAPVPHLLAANGTFMVYRKLHQNLATFRDYLEKQAAKYAGGKEKLAAKFIGRWRDGTPLELSPDKPDPSHRPRSQPQHQLHLWRGCRRNALSHGCAHPPRSSPRRLRL